MVDYDCVGSVRFTSRSHLHERRRCCKTPRKCRENKRTAINHCFRILVVYGSQTSEINCRLSQSLRSPHLVPLHVCRICDSINLLVSSCLQENARRLASLALSPYAQALVESNRSIQGFRCARSHLRLASSETAFCVPVAYRSGIVFV